MRNTRYFDLNVYDEQIAGALGISASSNRARTLALKKWKRVVGENEDALCGLFKGKKLPEFKHPFHGFSAGKFWQMLDYLDGNLFLHNSDVTDKDPHSTGASDRSHYQDRLVMENLFGGGRELLQVGWDIAINAALLSEKMQAPRNHGAQYLLEHAVWDTGSLMYPSITTEFQRRIINESFWQCLNELRHPGNLAILERILTSSVAELDVKPAGKLLARCVDAPGKVYEDLVVGYAGAESFHGLSPRAVRNYGLFLREVLRVTPKLGKEMRRYVGMFKKAVKCRDQDGINYFQPAEKAELLKLA
jgi:hypothetical protein